MRHIAATAIIYENVVLPDDIVIEDYCVIGIPTPDSEGTETVIGAGTRIRAGTYIYAGNHIGTNFQTGNKANIRELNTIGDNVSVGTLTVVEHHCEIHDGVRIHSQAFIPEFTVLEKNCWIGPNVVLTNAKYPRHPDTKSNLRGPRVNSNAKVGANVTILPGILIGNSALVGAGSVVAHDVADGTVVIGNPARYLKEVDY